MSDTRKVFDSFAVNAKDLFELTLRKELYSEYINKSLAEQLANVLGEMSEVGEAIEEGNQIEIEKELSDVIFVFIMFMTKLVKEGKLSKDYLANFGNEVKSKIFRRSPHLKENELISQEDEDKMRAFIKSQGG